MVAPRNGFQIGDLEARVERLLGAAELGQLEACWAELLGLVPTFRGERPEGMAPGPEAGRRDRDLAIAAAERSA
jgi:hypothetical protein